MSYRQTDSDFITGRRVIQCPRLGRRDVFVNAPGKHSSLLLLSFAKRCLNCRPVPIYILRIYVNLKVADRTIMFFISCCSIMTQILTSSQALEGE